MPQENDTVIVNSEGPQETEIHQKEVVEDQHQPSVQEDACILKQNDVTSSTPRSPVAEATEDFLNNEKSAYRSNSDELLEIIDISEAVIDDAASEPLVLEPRTPQNSEVSEDNIDPSASTEEHQQETTAPQVVEVLCSSENDVADEVVLLAPAATLNGHATELVQEEPQVIMLHTSQPDPSETHIITNGHRNGVCDLKQPECDVDLINEIERPQVLNGTVAKELVDEDYKLPDVVEVKKNFENIQPSGQNVAHAPPKKGVLSTSLDAQSIRKAYHDVRNDGSDTQWAVFKHEGPTIVTSAIGTDFVQFTKQFGDDERAFGYIRVQTGDEMSRRAKFLLVTWVGPSVSVLKRAKMSTDKALIKDIVSNFAVELQTENIADINLQNFETELDKAAGAHYGTGVRS